MDAVLLTGLVALELPGGTVRLCDGGTVKWGSDRFNSSDATLGSIGTLEAITEGAGDEVPALQMTLAPPADVDVDDIADPLWQGSRVRLWIAEVTGSTGLVTGTPELVFDGQIDTADLVLARGDRTVELDIVSRAERLFEANTGNTLSPRFHKKVWSGETGEDNAIGLNVTVAWGAQSPTGGAGAAYGGGGIGPSTIELLPKTVER